MITEPLLINVMSVFYLSINNNLLQVFVSNLTNDQILFLLIVFASLISIVAFFVCFVFLKNKKMREELDEKSSDLREAFEIMNKNNKKLQLANKELVNKNLQQKEFINTAAHELRTPTQAITGYIELIDELFKDLLDEKIEIALRDQGKEKTILQLSKYQQLVLKNATRLNDLINDLLDLAKIDLLDRDLRLNKERVDLIEEIKEFKDNYQTPRKKSIMHNDIIIKYDNKLISNNKILIDIDRTRFSQILNNIVNNSFKFSNENGKVTITIKESVNNKNTLSNNNNNNTVVISISDEGKGISQDMLPRLFERFVTDSESGTGLGLYITKKLVEAHGGSILGYNNSKGKGCTFEITLPTSK
ncbi:MAG TPA: HAMP domain-containing sensor histidine kinase [Candidatus Nitrosocosmicus sp.]|nr:HAMP domain-containing sensor histidine kinase [Candidatus Nitrosocosmicus sp.]